MSSSLVPSTSTPPRWVSWLLALVPVFPPLYLTALGGLGQLRTLPLPARWMLFFFAGTQLVAALFTPRPLLSVGLAAARTLLILAMIAAGVYLRESRHLRPLLWGQLVILVTAWGYTLLTQGVVGVQARLGHPYYYIVSLGLVAVVALWITVLWRGGRLWWRLPAGGLAAVTFLATGSRGPLLALVVGGGAALAISGWARRWWLLPVAALAAALTLGLVLGSPAHPLGRLLDDQLSGRDLVWRDAAWGWLAHPVGGVGPYQGGPFLSYLYKDGCQLTPTLERNDLGCPAWAASLHGVWLIAHNAWLHWLLETGVIGTLGLVAVMGYGGWHLLRGRDPLLVAIFFGYSAMGIVDVPIGLPSPHFAELWWAALGIGLGASALAQESGAP